MKKYLFIFIGLLSIQKIQSQAVFCPAGAEWHYWFRSSFVSAVMTVDNEKIKYVRDSIMGIDTVKVLKHNRNFAHYNTNSGGAITLVKQKGDTIFMRSLFTRNLWQILYNYGASAGQSWTTVVSSTTNFSVTLTYTITVDSVATTNINSFNLKKQYVKYRYQGSSPGESTTITERIGCTAFMLNYWNPSPYSDGDHTSGCICYQDSVFGLKQFTPYACDYSGPLGIGENAAEKSAIKIYPNPACDFIMISSDERLANGSVLSIYDFSGCEVKQVILQSGDDRKVSIGEFTEGLYLLKLKTKQGVLSGKLFKQD